MPKIIELFPEYFNKNSKYFKKLWETSIFVFDANVLLVLYFYPEEYAKSIIKIIKKLSPMIWAPYQVILEYLDNRAKTIHQLDNSINELKKILTNFENKFNDDLTKSFSVNPIIDSKKIIDGLKNYFEKTKKILDEKTKEILFEDKIGEPINSEELISIAELSKKRFEKEIPPGFKDKNNGDLIIWLKMIKKSKESNKNIIFITNDLKEDWWSKDKDKRIIGPKLSLIREFRIETDNEFYMYKLENFYKYAKKYFKEKPDKKIIEKIIKTGNYFERFQQQLNYTNELAEAMKIIGEHQQQLNYTNELAEIIKRMDEHQQQLNYPNELAETMKIIGEHLQKLNSQNFIEKPEDETDENKK